MQPTNMQLSNYVLDNFIEHKLSELTDCSVPALSDVLD
jgi:hypothetical protein